MGRYILTGGAGFIGSHLTDRLISAGHQVFVLDNLVTGRESNLSHLRGNKNFEFIQVEISEEFPDVGSVDGVLNFASPASPIDFGPLALPILRVGSFGTLHSLEYALRRKAWFFMASTSEVYGDPLEHPQRESYLGNVNMLGRSLQ